MENYVVCSFSLRVACYAALQLRPGCLGLIAPDCRSWGTPARGSSWRSGINVLGLGYPFVLQGNLMASRWLDFKHSTIYIYTVRLFMHVLLWMPMPSCSMYELNQG